MKFALDTEFIDTPTCSALISLALVTQDGRSLYFEVEYPEAEITPWLRQNVLPHLSGEKVSCKEAAARIRDFVGGSKLDRPEFWAYFGAHDWYWFCRIFGGMMEMPEYYPHLYKDFAHVQHGVPDLFGPAHNALNDARSLMAGMKKRGLA